MIRPFTTPRRIALAAGALSFLVYNLNGRVITDGDSIPARYLPFALLHSGRPRLESLGDAPLLSRKNPPHWVLRAPPNRVLSVYPIVTPVVITPLYVPAAIVLARAGWPQDLLEKTAIAMEKFSASLLTALSVGLLSFLIARRLSPGRAILLTAAYAFGTSAWPISSQALWQHGTAQLLFAIALLLAEGVPGTLALAASGAALGLAVANRPPDALLAAGVLAFLVVRFRVRSRAAVAGAAVAALPFLAYNILYFGHAAGGYAAVGLAAPHAFYEHAIAAGVAGLLFSPAKGLFVFSPFFLFLFSLAFAAVRKRIAAEDRLLFACLGAATAVFVLFMGTTDYRGGNCYGPRYLADALPFLTLLLVPAASALSVGGVRVFVATVAFSVFAQGVGAFCYPAGESDAPFYPRALPRLTIPPAVWSPRLCPIWVEARAAFKGARP